VHAEKAPTLQQADLDLVPPFLNPNPEMFSHALELPPVQ
jgi:hypothetical protein